MDGLLDQDPYIKATLVSNTGDMLGTCTSGVVTKGGKNPVWTDAHDNKLSFQYKMANRTGCKLLVEAWDKDIGSSDDLIGVGAVDLTAFVCEDRPATELTVPLRESQSTTSKVTLFLCSNVLLQCPRFNISLWEGRGCLPISVEA